VLLLVTTFVTDLMTLLIFVNKENNAPWFNHQKGVHAPLPLPLVSYIVLSVCTHKNSEI
jgi:hypothetical protein